MAKQPNKNDKDYIEGFLAGVQKTKDVILSSVGQNLDLDSRIKVINLKVDQ